ncbi:MAG: HAD family hydrolase [Acidimicrobiia bacterium]
MIEAVVFDLDGVLIDSETTWSAVRQQFVEDHGGRWSADAQRDMMGMSSPEWSRYMHDRLGVGLAPEQISGEVAADVAAQYRRQIPLLPGATEAVRALAARWPLGLASSANRSLIELALEEAQLGRYFVDSVSSEEVARGKPAPDVYVEAARRLQVRPGSCVAVEDSTNGIRSALAASMRVIAIPNRDFPPDRDVLARAHRVLAGLAELRPDVVERLDTAEGRDDAL